MKTVYLLYLVYATSTSVQMPGTGVTPTIGQAQKFVNEFATSQDCIEAGQRMFKEGRAGAYAFDFHCVPALKAKDEVKGKKVKRVNSPLGLSHEQSSALPRQHGGKRLHRW